MSQFLPFSDPSVPVDPAYWIEAFKQFGSFQDGGDAGVIITYAFKESGTTPDGQWTARPLTDADKAQILDAMAKISEIANVTFVEGDSATATLFFAATDATSGAVGITYPGAGGGAEVWARDLAPDTVANNAYIYKHELLHGLGLDHATALFGGAPPNLPDTEDDGTTLFGNWQVGWENTYQLFDIAALQYLYGPPAVRTGDDTYSLNPGAFDPTSPQSEWPLLWDGGGFDTLDYSALSVAVSITLVAGDLSRIGGASGGILDGGVFAINYRTVIEAAVGGSANDTLIGNDVANTLTGNAGNDLLMGGGAGDTLRGGAGVDTVSYANASAAVTVRLWSNTATGGDAQGDTISGFENVIGGNGNDSLIGSDNVANILNGGAGNDYLEGRSGDDTLIGGAGADRLIGGSGVDTVSYESSSIAVTVRLWNSTAAGGDAQGDTISGIENVTGGQGNDSLIGSDDVGNLLVGGLGNDYLEGRSGDDVLLGGAGADHMVGGDGVDTVSYAGASVGVTVRLWNSSASGGTAAGDTLSGFENITGGNGNDALVGSDNVSNVLRGGAGNDYLEGRSGDDTLIGGAGGDHMVGGDGADTVSYEGSTLGVTVRLWNSTATGGNAQGDTISGFENVIGSDGNDALVGSDTIGNTLSGGAGKDYLEGRSGDDVLNGGAGADKLVGGDGNDTFVLTAGQANGDTITDFAGNGAAAGDTLALSGYGTAAAGAHVTQIDATHWQIVSADGTIHDTIALANGASVDASDYIFGP